MRKFVLASLLALFALPVQAEPIPKELLDRDFRDCRAGGASEAYCRCLVTTYSKEITYQAYLTDVAEMHATLKRTNDPHLAGIKNENMFRIGRNCRLAIHGY